MKRFIQTFQRETGLANGEAILVLTVLGLLLIGWIGRSFTPDTTSHNTEQASKVIELLDSMLARTEVDTTQPAPRQASPSPLPKPTKRRSKKSQKRPVLKVNPNTASSATLDRLPGVGPSTARKIIEARPFTSVDDLLRVRGIGPATLEKMRPFLTVP